MSHQKPDALPGMERQPGEDLFTFGLRYPLSAITSDGPTDEFQIEEVDVYARSRGQALARLDAIVRRDYMPGWTEVDDLPRGGSGGWVEVYSS